MKKLFLGIISLLYFTAINAQNNWCGTVAMEQKFIAEHPELAAQIANEQAQLEQEIQARLASWKQNRSTDAVNYTIPVVFHIIHNGGPENISDEKIYAQIDRLNADYNGYQDDSADVHPPFKSIMGNANIQFVLAQIDPNGNPTNGIMRYQETPPGGGYSDNQMAGGRHWPADQYVNIYSVGALGTGGNVAAYTYRPGGWGGGGCSPSSTQNAIYSNYTYINGNGRTISHEMGHYFNLPHTWGNSNDPELSSNCSDDDGVDDTPNTIGQYGGCDLTVETCGSLDNVQNIMNYHGCNSGEMFTQGQVDKMRAALESTAGCRNSLWSDETLIATGVSALFKAEIAAPKIVCQNEQVNFHDATLLQGKNSWSWNVPGSNVSASTDKDLMGIYYNQPGLYDVTLDVSNGSQNLNATKLDRIFVIGNVGEPVPYSEDFEAVSALPNNNWIQMNRDRDGRKWQVTSEAAYSGTTSLKLNNFGSTAGYIDDLYSGSIDLSPFTAVDISMRIATAQVTGTNDVLEVWSFAECGTDSMPMLFGSLKGSGLAGSNGIQDTEFIPTDASQWEEFTFSVLNGTGHFVEDFLFKVSFKSDGGNNVYIDDVNITGTYKSYPILESPTSGTTGVASNVTLNWKAVGGVDEYEYELDTASTFDSPLYSTGTKTYISTDPTLSDTEFETADLIFGETYYWRVRAVTGGTPSAWSSIWNFTVAADGVGMETSSINKEFVYQVFPNPVSETATLRVLSSKDALVNVSVVDVLGKTYGNPLTVGVSSGENMISIPTQNLNPGVYMLVINADDNSQTLRFLKQ